jgi:hypothetical protein
LRKTPAEVVAASKDVVAVRAALDALRARPDPAARPALLGRFADLMAQGVKRDAGGYLRAAILQALRPVAGPEDVPLLTQATETYEFLPPNRSEEGTLLRATALVVLNEVDSTLAAYHATRLLADPHTSRLSGEPAATAVRVLAAIDQRLPLYYYALHQPEPQSEVLSECLKNLAGMPAALLPHLLTRHGATRDEVVLVGLLDLALEYEPVDFVRDFMRSTRLYAVYHYLVTRLVASHVGRWLAVVAGEAHGETDPRKMGLLEEALALGRPDPVVQAALGEIRERRAVGAAPGGGRRR